MGTHCEITDLSRSPRGVALGQFDVGPWGLEGGDLQGNRFGCLGLFFPDEKIQPADQQESNHDAQSERSHRVTFFFGAFDLDGFR